MPKSAGQIKHTGRRWPAFFAPWDMNIPKKILQKWENVPEKSGFPLLFAGESRKMMGYQWPARRGRARGEKGRKEMNSQLSERIRLHSANFSKGQRMIARYIEEHSEQVAFMTASRLGQTVGVSESTVVRFATEIGYSGYPALQQAMQEMIRSKMTSVQRLERTSTTIPMDPPAGRGAGPGHRHLKAHQGERGQGGLLPGRRRLGKRPKRSTCWGRAAAWPWPPLWPTTCAWCLKTVHLVEATSEATILQQMVHVGEGDAVIAISFPRYSKKAVKTMKYASSQKATTVAITDSPCRPWPSTPPTCCWPAATWCPL